MTLVAAFARGNHDIPWPNAFRFGLIGGPIAGMAVFCLVHSSSILLIFASLSLMIGAYLWYRHSFSSRKGPGCRILVPLIAILVLTTPGFLAQNIALVGLLALSLALYLAWWIYSRLFGTTRLVSYSLFVFFATRIPLALIAYVSRLYMRGPPKSLRELLVHWDAPYYLDIAESGYHLQLNDWSTAPFYPLLPFLIRSFRILTQDVIIAGLTVSNLSFICGLCLLYFFACKHWGDAVARRAVFLISIAPATFFFSAIYTESPFLLLSMLFFVLVVDDKWLAAGICGILAVLTRSVGVILVPVGLWEYARSIQFDFRRLRPNLVYLLLIPLGGVLFGFIQYAQVGDFMASVAAQAVWEREPMRNPIFVLFRDWKALDFNLATQELWRLQITVADGASVVAAFLAILAVLPLCRRLGVSAAIFVGLGVVLPLSTGTSYALLRFIHVLFPIFIYLSICLKNKRAFAAVIVAFLSLLVFFVMLHVNDLLMA